MNDQPQWNPSSVGGPEPTPGTHGPASGGPYPGGPYPPPNPGYPQPPYPGYPQPGYAPPPDHPRAVVVLVLGILSLVAVGFLAGIPALVMGRRAIREVDASQGRVGGRTMLQVGWWCGLIGTVWSLFVFLLFVALIVFGVVASVSSSGGSSGTF